MSRTREAQTVSVAGTFDGIAPFFEESFENSSTRLLRKKLYAVISSLARPGAAVLDINCGVGIDAIELAGQGYDVTGIDISPEMIQQAKNRAKKYHATGVRFLVASFEDLSALHGKHFDLILSNFGGVNCVPSLGRVAMELASLTKPRGHVVAVVMPPLCAWEILAGLARLNAGLAFRRLKESAQATGFGGRTFSVHYHAPGAFARAFGSWFEVRQLRGLNIISPPPGARRFRETHPRLSGFLERFDEIVSRFPIARAIGDHYMITLRRASDVVE